MQVVGVAIESGIDSNSVFEALTSILEDHGRVAVVRTGSVASASPPVTTTLDLDDGRLSSAHLAEESPGDRLDVALEMLAENGYEYALLGPGIPHSTATIAVGDVDDIDGRVIAEVTPTHLQDSTRVEDIPHAIDRLESYETLGSLIDTITEHPESTKAGAIATFTGRVRAENLDIGRTTHLEYEKYEDVADAELAAIREELTAREGVYEVLLHHHTGVVEAGEDAVYVVVLAGHREEAFRAVEDGIDLLKARVPIFKKEVTESGAYWAHNRP